MIHTQPEMSDAVLLDVQDFLLLLATTDSGRYHPRLDDSDSIGLNRPGERRSCIILNCLEGNTMDNISLSDIRLTFGGGGMAENAARRELPNIAAEYFLLREMPAYGLYARNARGIALSNIRFRVRQQGDYRGWG